MLAALLMMAACAQPEVVAGFRDPGRQIYSSAVFDPATITGTWTQVADFAASPGCKASALRFAAMGAGIRTLGQVCLAGVLTQVDGPLVLTGPGRFTLSGVADPLWVLWADADVRTLVIGTPSGRFGFILNRDGRLPPDRLTAAREILAWNGYDLERLQPSP